MKTKMMYLIIALVLLFSFWIIAKLITNKVFEIGDFQWGDVGDLFFVIHKSDLASQDFRNVHCTMYSS